MSLRTRLQSLLGRAPEPPEGEMHKVPDDLPRDGAFRQPVVVSGITVKAEAATDIDDTDVEVPPGHHRVTFTALVKDADGKRCPELHVAASIAGPERTASGEAWTDIAGKVKFRMTGPAGTYRLDITDVAAGALELDRDTSELTMTTETD